MNEETIRCTSCNKGLLHFFIKDATKPKSILKIAECPFCLTQNIVKTINGSFCLGPIGTDETKTGATLIEDMKACSEANSWLLTVRKFNEKS